MRWGSRLFVALAAGAFLVAPAVASPASAQATGPITLPAAQFDSHEGTTIHAGDGWYYHFGNDYGCSLNATWCGVEVIRAQSLSGPWSSVGFAFDAQTGSWPQWCDTGPGSYGCYDPVVTYDPNTSEYVMWVDVNGHHNASPAYEPSGYAVLTSADPSSGYQLQAFHVQMNEPSRDVQGLTYGDQSAVWNDDGQLYLAFTVITPPDNYHTIWLTQLDSSGVDPVGNPVQISNTDDEGPGLFLDNGYWFDTMSWPAGGDSGGGCAFCNNAYTEYSATEVAGDGPLDPGAGWTWPTSEPGNVIGSPGCDGQPDHVDYIDGTFYQEINEWNPPAAGSSFQQAQADQASAGLVLYPIDVSGNQVQSLGC